MAKEGKIEVAPYTGAWIEILIKVKEETVSLASLPTRERGLKCTVYHSKQHPHQVAPYTGAWIEIKTLLFFLAPPAVAPYTGAWIEITKSL